MDDWGDPAVHKANTSSGRDSWIAHAMMAPRSLASTRAEQPGLQLRPTAVTASPPAASPRPMSTASRTGDAAPAVPSQIDVYEQAKRKLGGRVARPATERRAAAAEYTVAGHQRVQHSHRAASSSLSKTVDFDRRSGREPSPSTGSGKKKYRAGRAPPRSEQQHDDVSDDDEDDDDEAGADFLRQRRNHRQVRSLEGCTVAARSPGWPQQLAEPEPESELAQPGDLDDPRVAAGTFHKRSETPPAHPSDSVSDSDDEAASSPRGAQQRLPARASPQDSLLTISDHLAGIDRQSSPMASVQVKLRKRKSLNSKRSGGRVGSPPRLGSTRVVSPLRVASNGMLMASHDQAAAETLSALRRKFRAASYSATGMDIPRLFQYYDRDNSGEISFEKFRRAVRRDAKLTKQEVQDEALKHIFDIADTDGGKTIGLSEFEGLLLGPRSNADGTGVLDADGLSPRALTFSETRSARLMLSPQRRLGDQYMRTHGKKKNTAKGIRTKARLGSPSRRMESPPAAPSPHDRLRQKFRAASYSAAGMDVLRLFQYYDRDNSGEISFDEFMNAVRRDAKLGKNEVSDAALKKIFDKADTDGGGSIDLDEFEDLLLGAGSPGPAQGGPRGQSPRQRAKVVRGVLSPTRADTALDVEPWDGLSSEGSSRKAADARRKKGLKALKVAKAQGAAEISWSAFTSPQRRASLQPRRPQQQSAEPLGELADALQELSHRAAADAQSRSPPQRMATPPAVLAAALEAASAASPPAPVSSAAAERAVVSSLLLSLPLSLLGDEEPIAVDQPEPMSARAFEARWQDKLQGMEDDLIDPLHEGLAQWEELLLDEDGREGRYYHHKPTGETRWDAPPGWNSTRLEAARDVQQQQNVEEVVGFDEGPSEQTAELVELVDTLQAQAQESQQESLAAKRTASNAQQALTHAEAEAVGLRRQVANLKELAATEAQREAAAYEASMAAAAEEKARLEAEMQALSPRLEAEMRAAAEGCIEAAQAQADVQAAALGAAAQAKAEAEAFVIQSLEDSNKKLAAQIASLTKPEEGPAAPGPVVINLTEPGPLGLKFAQQGMVGMVGMLQRAGESVESAYNRLDENRDGVLSYEELLEAGVAPGLASAVFVDTSGNTELLGVNPGTQAERHPELTPGLILVTVNGAAVAGKQYCEIIEMIKAGGRPLLLSFKPGTEEVGVVRQADTTTAGRAVEELVRGKPAPPPGRSPTEVEQAAAAPEPEPEQEELAVWMVKQAAPSGSKQLSRKQCREMELFNRLPNVTDEWIDALFDEFDDDKSNTIDDDEWEELAAVLKVRPFWDQEMTKQQVRERVRLHLEANRDTRDATNAWIDARFDRFDADRSGTVDESEWDKLVNSMDPVVVTITEKRPWGMEMRANRNNVCALTLVKKGGAAARVGLLVGMTLTSVNGQRVTSVKNGHKLSRKAKLPVVLGFDQLAPSKQLLRRQMREMVRIQLELEGRDPSVTDEWLDALFDEFDVDKSNTIDDDEWEKLVGVLASRRTPVEELTYADALKSLDADGDGDGVITVKELAEWSRKQAEAESVTVLRLRVPEGKRPGETMEVPLPGGHVIAFEIPDGMQPGDEFEAELPTEIALEMDTDDDGVITEVELAVWMAKQAAADPEPESPRGYDQGYDQENVTVLRLRVPEGKRPGETMEVPLPGGHIITFEIPDDIPPGDDDFEAQLPTEIAALIDTDGDGVVTEEELAVWMVKQAAPAKRKPPPPPAAALPPAPAQATSSTGAERLKSFLADEDEEDDEGEAATAVIGVGSRGGSMRQPHDEAPAAAGATDADAGVSEKQIVDLLALYHSEKVAPQL